MTIARTRDDAPPPHGRLHHPVEMMPAGAVAGIL
jgi:hypothetical protein